MKNRIFFIRSFSNLFLQFIITKKKIITDFLMYIIEE